MNGKRAILFFAMQKLRSTNLSLNNLYPLAKHFCERVLFFVLIPFEYLYHLIFFIDQAIKKYRGSKTGYPFKIISVGNLSVGGTGKSIVAPFLVKLLGEDRCAIVMRGYGGRQERANKPILVGDGNQLFCSVAVAGDEAVMHATQLACPVVVSAQRVQGCDLIRDLFLGKINYLILDDAYQHHSVKKDIDIVLLDARKPFDNGHCLPAGRLREKDLSRVSFVMMTHSDQISDEQQDKLQNRLQKQLGNKPIFWGKHAFDGLYRNNEELVVPAFFERNKFVVVAGIGRPANIEQSLKKINLTASAVCVFPNHAPYRERDLESIFERAQAVGVKAVITTAKDWVKLAPLVLAQGVHAPLRLRWYVLRVRYELLDQDKNQDIVSMFVRHGNNDPD